MKPRPAIAAASHDCPTRLGTSPVALEFGAPRVFACSRRDALVARLRAGETAAIEIAIRALPRDLDSGFCRSVRDQEIRRMAMFLSSALPGKSLNAIAKLLADAGAALDRPGGSLRHLRVLDQLAPDEIASLDVGLETALQWCTRRRDGRRWLRQRQILNIV